MSLNKKRLCADQEPSDFSWDAGKGDATFDPTTAANYDSGADTAPSADPGADSSS